MVLPVASTQLARAPAAPDGGLLARTSLLYVRAMCAGQQPGMRMRGALVAALQAQGARCYDILSALRMWAVGWRLCSRSSTRGVPG